MYYNKKKKTYPVQDDAKEEFKFNDPIISTLIGDHLIMERIAHGTMGATYRAISLVSQQTVALKRVTLQGTPQQQIQAIQSECVVFRDLSHVNIVKYLDSISTQSHLNIIMEYAQNGSLSTLLTKLPNSRMPETLVCHYMAQVLKGLQYLHTHGVIHGNVRAANILSTKDGVVKLVDFGVTMNNMTERKSDSVVETPYWMAPEVIQMPQQPTSACDIWSVGSTAIELFTGKPPYCDLESLQAQSRIVRDDHPPLPDGITPAMESFLLACFQKNPHTRTNAHALLQHTWLENVVGRNDTIMGTTYRHAHTQHNSEHDMDSKQEQPDLPQQLGSGPSLSSLSQLVSRALVSDASITVNDLTLPPQPNRSI